MKALLITIITTAALLNGAPASAALYLEWLQSESAQQPVEYYRILRRLESEPNYLEVAKLAGNVRKAVDTTTMPGKSYCYQVVSGNTAGEAVSADSCSLNPGVAITIKQGQILVLSRRATNGGTVIGALLNADEIVTENSGDPVTVGIKINYRQDKQFLASRRTTNNSSIVALLVDRDEVVMANGQVIP